MKADQMTTEAGSAGETADQQIARIIKAGEPGVESAMRVLEITEQHYYEAVHQTMPPPITTRTASHS
jgi:hypothetical protein